MKDLKIQMMEKYLHSRGAVLYDEGRVDEAIISFQHAVALDDRSYTRCDLSLAFIRKNDLDRALREIDRAIALSPTIARYHYERGLIQSAKGDESEARRSLEKAIVLDSNYSRIDEIQQALRILDEASSSGAIRISFCHDRIQDPTLREAIVCTEKDAGLPGGGLEAVSCTLPCPAFCCHFEGSPLLHGVSIGPWKLLKIRELLKEKGFREDDYLERTDVTGQEQVQSLIPPDHLLRERGSTCVYSPQKGKSTLNPALLTVLPKGRAYQDLFWIHANSWECSFLGDRRCMIHDAGDEPALPACKEFLCLTGFVFALLARWDLVEYSAVSGITMKRLNQVAIEAALILPRELCQAEDLMLIKASLEALISEAQNADGLGDLDRITYLVSLIQNHSARLTKAVASRKDAVRRRVTEMLGTLTFQ